MDPTWRKLALTLPCLWVVCQCLGCGGASPPGPAQTNLHHLASLFLQYTAAHKGQTPKDLDDFKKFVRSDPQRLQALQIADPETLFVSPRDHQPYLIEFKIKSARPGSKEAPVFAREKTGVNGKRFVALATGEVREVDEGELQSLLAERP